MRRSRGFTLIELAVVVLVLGVAAAAVLPRLGGAELERARLRSSANKLAAAAAYARDRAACTRAVHVLHVDLNGGTYWVKPLTRSANAGAAPVRGKLPDGVRFTDVQVAGGIAGGVVELRFSPEGWADAAAIHLGLADGSAATVLIAGLCGRAETHDGRLGIGGGDAYDDVTWAAQ